MSADPRQRVYHRPHKKPARQEMSSGASLIRLYSKAGQRVYQRVSNLVYSKGRGYYRSHNLDYTGSGDTRTRQFEAFLQDWIRETLLKEYCALTGEVVCAWQPHPNRNFQEFEVRPVTQIERAWFPALESFDHILADVEDRVEDGLLHNHRKAKMMKHRMQLTMLKIPRHVLANILSGKNIDDLYTDSVNNLVDKMTETT